MIEIVEVKTKSDIKEFIEFPLRLYKDCEYFVPPLYGDERKLILAGGQPKVAKSVFFLAKRDGATVGRIQGILQYQANEKNGNKRVRFTRFDSINDVGVSRALFSAVEKWGRELGMTELCGPLGYSDMDREGLLVEGFDENSTFEEQYNYDYYPALCEDYGLVKEIDWLEFSIIGVRTSAELLHKVAERTLELNKLHVVDQSRMSKNEYINMYKDQFFEVLDECYSHLYGTVDISEETKKELISQFMLIINKQYFIVIADESGRMVAFGLCFPSIADAVKKSGGRLTPGALLRIFRAVSKPEVIDLALVAIRPQYRNSGLNAIVLSKMADYFEKGMIKSFETNLNLETNTAVISQWRHFEARQHKRRRSYVKTIS